MNKEELKETIKKEHTTLITKNAGAEWEKGLDISLGRLFYLIDQLDEPKPQLSGKEWLKDKLNKRIGKLPAGYTGSYSEGSRDAYTLVLQDLDQLDEPKVTEEMLDKYGMSESKWKEVIERYKWHLEEEGYIISEKPVIPIFVAEWIEDNKEDGYTLQQCFYSIHHRYKQGDFDNVVEWVSSHEELFSHAYLSGYTIEEKKYRVRAGKYYVKFNLDGTMIGVRKQNSVVTKERLDKLPFDIDKAVDSGIIKLEEVKQ